MNKFPTNNFNKFQNKDNNLVKDKVQEIKNNINKQIVQKDKESNLDKNLNKGADNVENNENLEKQPKAKKIRLKLDENNLFYTENGIKKFYDVIDKTQFHAKPNNEEHNLNKLIKIFKNWHFILFPKYDIDFFISKISEIGKRPSSRAYMSRLRKIYKGEESWDVLYNDQDQILNPKAKNNELNKDKILSSPNSLKSFREDNSRSEINSSSNIKVNFNNKINKISSKLDKIGFTNNQPNNNLYKLDNNNKDETDVQDLFFNEIKNNHTYNENDDAMMDANEKDYDNFDHFNDHNEDEDKLTELNNLKLSKQDSISETSSFYKREKRLHSDAFGNDDKNNNNEINKKIKID